MRPRARILRLAVLAALTIAAVLAAPAPAALAAPAPAWSLSSLATPTNFVRGDAEGKYVYDVRATNLGGKATDGSEITIVDTLPAGLEVSAAPELKVRYQGAGSPPPEPTLVDLGPECEEEESAPEVTTLTCAVAQLPGDQRQTAELVPLEELRLEIPIFTPESLGEGQILTNHVEVSGGGAPTASTEADNAVAILDEEGNPQPAEAGFSYYQAGVSDEEGQPATQAGSHPFQLTTNFALNTRPAAGEAPIVTTFGDPKDIGVALPAGLVGNPSASALCTAQQFNTLIARSIGKGGFYDQNACPDSSAVGVVTLKQVDGLSLTFPTSLYNLVPAPGLPAQLGFQYANLPFYIDAEVEPDPSAPGGYTIEGVLHNTSQAKRVGAASVTIWGTPEAKSHDQLRGSCLLPGFAQYGFSLGSCPGKAESPKPFLRLPTNCANPLGLTMSLDYWTAPGAFISQTSPGPVGTGCGSLGFEPTLQARPTTNLADSPSGLDVDLHLPQKEHEDPAEPGQADLRDVTVQLPAGLVVNPSGANGLDACAPAQIDLHGAGPAQCPAASRIGEVEVDTPLLDHPLPGYVYVATPHENPFGSLLAIYIVVQDPRSGVIVKLAGEVSPDAATGRLQASFEENPQLPFEDFKLHFYGGPLAALRSPATCGAYATDSTLTPWSAPESGPPATDSDAYSIEDAPAGGPCPTEPSAMPNAPAFSAGTADPIAARFSPLLVHLRREDGSQELGQLTVTPPPGLLAKLAGVPQCPEVALSEAEAKSGRQEEAQPSCPAASRVGTATVGAGAGPAPYYTQGIAYLSGPYKGAPLSLAVITPAAAGPYDLGTVVTRVALDIDSETARVSAVSDPIPHILQGIPLDVRSIAVKLDRPGFTLNPTSCNEMAFGGAATSVLGLVAPLSDRFQVGECTDLSFKPKLNLRLTGKKTNRGAHPSLRATLTVPAGGANLAKAQVTLPRSEFIDQAHFRTICTRVQFKEGPGNGANCPAGSIYGYAKATTPLLDGALEGPVYLRSTTKPDKYVLPDVVVALKGPPSTPIEVDAVGHVDSVKGALRANFEAIPDAPISQVTLTMQGGAKGLFQNSTDLCQGAHRATVLLDAQNGEVADSRPKVAAKCAKGQGKKHRRGKRHHAAG